jgi:hypothetical protein
MSSVFTQQQRWMATAYCAAIKQKRQIFEFPSNTTYIVFFSIITALKVKLIVVRLLKRPLCDKFITKRLF